MDSEKWGTADYFWVNIQKEIIYKIYFCDNIQKEIIYKIYFWVNIQKEIIDKLYFWVNIQKEIIDKLYISELTFKKNCSVHGNISRTAKHGQF